MDDFEMDQSVDSNDFVMAELPFSVEDTPLLGRHLVAQRNLDRGELILCETPTGIDCDFHRSQSLLKSEREMLSV